MENALGRGLVEEHHVKGGAREGDRVLTRGHKLDARPVLEDSLPGLVSEAGAWVEAVEVVENAVW